MRRRVGQLVTHNRGSIFNPPSRRLPSGNLQQELVIEWEPGVNKAQKDEVERKLRLLRSGRAGPNADRYIRTGYGDLVEIINKIEARPEIRSARFNTLHHSQEIF